MSSDSQQVPYVLRIANWSKLYENAASRKRKSLAWVPITNSFESTSYSDLWIDYEPADAAKIFTAFIACVQLGSKCHPRGTLLRSNGKPHNARSIAAKTRIPVEIFDYALPVLIDHIGWIVTERYRASADEVAGHANMSGLNRIEEKGTEQKGSEVNYRAHEGGIDSGPLSDFIQGLQDACAWAAAIPDHVYLRAYQIHRGTDLTSVLQHMAFQWSMQAPENPPSAILAAFRKFDKSSEVRPGDGDPLVLSELPVGFDDQDRPYFENGAGELVYKDGTKYEKQEETS